LATDPVGEVLDRLPENARVVVCGPSGPDFARVITGCLDRALTAVPVDPRVGEARLTEITGRVAACAVIDGRDGCWSARTGPGDRADPSERGPSERGPGDLESQPGLSFVIFTSGSTGAPKGVMLGWDSVRGNAEKVTGVVGIGSDRPHATCLPFFHVNALMMSLVGARITGAPLVICDKFSPHEYFRQIGQASAVTAAVVPALLHRIVEARPPWPESLDCLITAAAPLERDLAERFYRAYGPRLRQGYGQSEAVNFSFMMPPLDSAGFREHYLRRHPPVGVALPATELVIDDGEVVLRTPDVMRGYWADPATTATALTPDGWLRTGDLGELRDGFLVLRGRRDEVINRGGEKVYPLDVEGQWRQAGLAGQGAAVPVSAGPEGQDIGLVLASGSLLWARGAAGGTVPLAAETGGLLTTSTGKLKRKQMGRRLVGRRENPARYRELLGYATQVAASIAASTARPQASQATRLLAHVAWLAGSQAAKPGPDAGAVARSAAHDALDLLAEYWPVIAAGTDGGDGMMRQRPGLWRRLMTEWPMGSYAELACAVLSARELLRGPVLEVGSGVGNTTALIAPLVQDSFTWSDGSSQLVARGRWPGRGVVFDFDQPPPDDLGTFATIVATNALHCAADKGASLAWLRSLLRPGGTLVLAEGSNPTTPDGLPWALDFLFCAFSGWWDRTGFLTRWEWLRLLEEAGFEQLGYSVLRSGQHDLGGVVWGCNSGG
jgi:acyl-CoA synthetase (AMP-forming)/AMP-acid ligase II/SAM-dependent methyltransferase